MMKKNLKISVLRMVLFQFKKSLLKLVKDNNHNILNNQFQLH